MSFDALAWAGKCKPGTASRKLVLLALADRHNNETNVAYPSIAWLVEFTDLNRKTIINCLDVLEESGFISDSGQRKGTTGQIKAYTLHIESVPKAEPFQKRNSSKNDAKQSQKRDTEPVRTRLPSEAKASSGTRAKPNPKLHELPDDWQPQPFGLNTESRKIVDGWPPGEAAIQLETFRAHHGKKGDRFKDWQKAWSTWVLNSRNFRKPENGRTNSLAGYKPDQQTDGLGRTGRAAMAVLERIRANGVH